MGSISRNVSPELIGYPLMRYWMMTILPLPLLAQQPAAPDPLTVLRRNCQACHNANLVNGGLALDSKEALLKGGNRGPDLKLILSAMRHDGDLKMPKGGKRLPDADIAAVEQWMKAGMPVPASFEKARRRTTTHWAYQPVTPRDKFPSNASIDSFIAAKLAEKSLQLSPEADKRTLLRRVHLDITGLPPTDQELQAFLTDNSPNAYEKVVDKLLASPAYAERWGRHWLDIARYADTDGYTIDAPRDIWPYRDWVLRALRDDMPFDQFVIEQFAGDLLPNPSNEQLIATGFHRNTPSNYEGGIDFEQYRVEAIADRVSTTGAAFMGLTLGCARCHDHKYDAVTQREFYQLFAFWNNVDEVDKEADRKFFNQPFLIIGTEEQKAELTKWEADVIDIEAKMRARQEKLTEDFEKDEIFRNLRDQLNARRKQKPKLLRSMIMKERPAPREAYIHLGGDFTRKGSSVVPGVPAVLPPIKENPSRLDFARWLMSRENPLTARVTVNRVWTKYFGRGIVDTENDFGVMGDKPTHPELLDFLAASFMASNWSQKQLHKQIVMSAVYRQSSAHRPEAESADPNNVLYHKQNRLRLDAEILRDASLVASGLLHEQFGGPSFYPPIPAGALSVTQVVREWPTAKGPERYRRGMYTFFRRSAAHPSLAVFDAADGIVACTRRIRSNTPLQALTMLNDEASVEFASALAKRILSESALTDEARLRHGYMLTLQRDPRAAEVQRFNRFLKQRRDSDPNSSDAAVWTAVSRVLLNLDEFLTRE
jgi:mono/diheme cytochrome c family protein